MYMTRSKIWYIQNLRNLMCDAFRSQEELRSHVYRLEVPGRDPADRTSVEAGSCTKSCNMGSMTGTSSSVHVMPPT